MDLYFLEDRIKIREYSKKAKKIAIKLGTWEKYRKGEFSGCKYHDITLSKNDPYGLNITYCSSDDIYIEYNNKIVMDSKHKTIERGPWEDVLLETYNRLPSILREKQEQERLNERALKFMEVLYAINKYMGVEVSISPNIEVTISYSYTEGYYSCSISGRYYTIKVDDKVVFSASDGGSTTYTKIHKYIPGEWENDVKRAMYNGMNEYNRKVRANEQRQAEESIQRLRKKY